MNKPYNALKICLLALILFVATPVYAHTDSNNEAKIHKVVLAWSNGILNADAEELDKILAENFSTSVFTWSRLDGLLNKKRYLTRVKENSFDISRVELRYADYKRVGKQVIVSPIVIYLDKGTLRQAVELTLQKIEGAWKIIKNTTTFNLPDEEMERFLPEHVQLYKVDVHVIDAETAEPIGSRVNATDSEGEYWPPVGHRKYIHTGFREDVGADVKVDGKTYAYVGSNFVLPLAEGSYELLVMRGLEFEPQIVSFNVVAGKVPNVEVALKRWSNIQEQGWYSADPHVHFLDPYTAKLELDGENLNVLGLMATQFGELVVGAEYFTGEPSRISDPEQIVYVGEELRHGFYGHTVLHNLDELLYPLAWGGPGNGVPGGYDYPTMAQQLDHAHEQDALVSWAHFPEPGGELAVDVVLGKVDAIELVMWTDPFDEHRAAPAAKTYYRLLNTGAKLPAIGGTDKMLNTQVVGSVRTYTQFDGEFSYDGWVEGVRAGRTFVTSGPMLMFNVDGHELGETIVGKNGDVLPVRAEVNSLYPVDRIEIIQGGKIVAEIENKDGARKLILEAEITVDDSSWLVARAYSSKKLPYQTWDFIGAYGIPEVAHTSPIYIEVDGKKAASAEDAAYFVALCDRAIEWVKTKARVHTEEQRQEMLEIYEKARDMYLMQIPNNG